MNTILRFIAYSQSYVESKWQKSNPVFMYIVVMSAVFSLKLELLLRFLNIWKSPDIFLEPYFAFFAIAIFCYLYFGDKYLKKYIDEYNDKKEDKEFARNQRTNSWLFILFCILVMAVLAKINFHLRYPLA